MKLRQAMRNSAVSVWRQRRRSFLAALGITVGVAVGQARADGRPALVLTRLDRVRIDLEAVPGKRILSCDSRTHTL